MLPYWILIKIIYLLYIVNLFTYDVCLLRKHILSKTLKKKSKWFGTQCWKFQKAQVKRIDCGARVAIRPLSIKISKCCKSNFKSRKVLTYPQMLKFVLADFMVHETSTVNSCWEAYSGKIKTIWTTESKSDNKKVMVHCPD